MSRISLVASIVAAAGIAAPALAQDSVSNLGTGLPGDALSPWDNNQQVRNYVVDLTPFSTSWGTQFGIAPIVKLSRSSSGFYSSLPNAQFISQDKLLGVEFPAATYALWENTPGAGVNGQANSMPGTVSPTGPSTQFGVGFAEFGTTDAGNSYNAIIGALVNYSADNPNRLYVRRALAANNTPDPAFGDVSQFGFGSIDASGNAYYRGDAFGLAGSPGFTNISGNNLFRTDVASRTNGTPSIISAVGTTADATTALLLGNGTNHGPANNIPESIAGGNGLIATSNFNGEYVRGATSPLTADASHLAAIATGTRGNLGGSTKTPLGGAFTFGQLIQAGGSTQALNVFGVDAAGNVTGTLAGVRPTTVIDPSDGFVVNYTGADEFRSYGSQVAFRGGTGNIAVGEDQDGRLLTASTNYFVGGTGNDNFPINQILVARENGTGGLDWSVAAYIAPTPGTPHKAILDGPGGNIIGRQAPLLAVTGGTPNGPSMSVPAFDSAGNIWFIGAVELFDFDEMGNVIGSDFDSALIRAVYNPADFSYELELVLELGNVFPGMNSGVPYQIQFLNLADSNSISSGSFFSGNASSTAWNNADISGASPADAITNGGVVLVADIVYDVDLDGDFNDPTSANNTDPTSIDESYNALLYVGNYVDGPMPCNDADIAEPFGTLNIDDVLAFLNAFAASDSAADIAPPAGVFDIDDVLAFLNAFAAGCP